MRLSKFRQLMQQLSDCCGLALHRLNSSSVPCSRAPSLYILSQVPEALAHPATSHPMPEVACKA